VLDSDTRELLVDGQSVHIQPKAFQLLELLLENRPKAVSKRQIHERLWPGTFVSDSTLSSLLTEIRTAIHDDARASRFVRTLHRFGYAFSGSAQELGDRPSGLARRKSTYWLVRGRRRFPLEVGESIIGRDAGATVFLDEPGISRRHARVAITDEGATLEDLGSKNGTYLQGSRIESPSQLSDRDRIRLGLVTLTMRIFVASESTKTEAVEGGSASLRRKPPRPA
jgi:DNA-binding winged helix-turn-helix (wHTH) protein